MMKVIDRYLERRWSALIETVKDNFNTIDIQIGNGLCRDSWETFAWYLRQDYPAIELYRDAAKLQCGFACEKLDDFEASALLAWRWDDVDLERMDRPVVEDPWDLPTAEQRNVLSELLWESVEEAAANDGDKVYYRQWIDEEHEDTELKDADGETAEDD